MGLSTQEQVRYWGLALAAFVGFVWLVGDTLLPFVIGMAIAYFLDPVADRLEAARVSRIWATVIITTGAVLIMLLAILILAPMLVDQTTALVKAVPELTRTAQSYLSDRFPDAVQEDSPLRTVIADIGNKMSGQGLDLINTVLTRSLAVVDFILVLVLAPVIAFYMLNDWDRMTAQIDRWLPREHAPYIREIARQVDDVLAGFVRGQLTVCGILGTFYAVALMLVGLQFGLIIGMFAGLISFIPFVGSILGGAISIAVALFQFWPDPVMIGAVVAIFVAGQAVEGNYLTPRLVGGSVGLHPVWLMFALSVFGAFFGFLGMLIAVPAAAVIGVVFRFAMAQYMQGRLYRGQDGSSATAEDPE